MRRILLVEDDEEAVRMLGYALRENGYEVVTAATGFLALAEIAKRDADVILLDLFLSGGMNGGEFLQQYRRSGGRAKVLVTSGAGRSDPVAKDLVVDEWFSKPLDLERLLDTIRRVAYG